MTGTPVLYDYWRSSASYRVRIALHLAGITFETVPVNLLERAHKAPDHLARNPQGLVPALAIDGVMLTQSLAIVEYLDETRAAGLLPQEAVARARVRALAYAIAMEIHPVCNLGVVAHVADLTGGGDAARKAWMGKFIAEGLAGFEAMLNQQPESDFCWGNRPTMVDICLVPQVYNARRWEVEMAAFPRAARIAARCENLEAFARAHPDRVKPA